MKTLKDLQKEKEKNLHLVGKRFKKKGGKIIRIITELLIRPQQEDTIEMNSIEDSFDPKKDNYVHVVFMMGMYRIKIKLEDFYNKYEILK